MDLLKDSLQDNGRTIDHNPMRLFWTIARVTGNQWVRRNSAYMPPEAAAANQKLP
jgi:hypothetical protein